MAAQFPDGVDIAGPRIGRLLRQPIEYAVTQTLFEDGGCDVNVSPCGMLRWQLEYEGLSQADVATLRTHYNDARGTVESFQFYDRQTGLTHSVQYRSFEIGKHEKTWFVPATIVLETLS